MLKVFNQMPAMFMVIMLLAQVGVAQHATVHFTEHIECEHSHDHHEQDDHDKEDHPENCQICLLAKTLAFALTDEQEELVTLSFAKGDFSAYSNQINITHWHDTYNPRAPPSVLI